MGSKIAEKIVKPTPVPEANQRNVQEITIPLDKRQGILNTDIFKLRQVS